jgi:hypothetical protein
MDMKPFEKYLMLITFSLAFLGIVGLIPQIISILLILSAAIYLSIGWKLLKPFQKGQEAKAKVQVIPFLVSYLISQTIIVVLFGMHNYPLKNEFSYITTAMLVVAIILLLIFNKTLKINYPVNKYLLRLLVCVMFSLAPMWMEAMHKV